MRCEVEFHDETTGRAQMVILVDPREADIEQRKISVLTPVGTAADRTPLQVETVPRIPRACSSSARRNDVAHFEKVNSASLAILRAGDELASGSSSVKSDMAATRVEPQSDCYLR
jgi:hypothetical protein